VCEPVAGDTCEIAGARVLVGGDSGSADAKSGVKHAVARGPSADGDERALVIADAGGEIGAQAAGWGKEVSSGSAPDGFAMAALIGGTSERGEYSSSCVRRCFCDSGCTVLSGQLEN
jgi:hypothetical protein